MSTDPATSQTAIVTGASSGIGAATVAVLSQSGFRVTAGARRLDKLEVVTAPCNATPLKLDLTDPSSVTDFVNQVPKLDLLVNNAGAAFALNRIEASQDDLWQKMYEINVLGALRMTRACLPLLLASGGQVINVGSTSSFETYPGGGGYTASKHALRALTRTLRAELLGQPVRVTEICPGLVETEFSVARFGGDRERAGRVYQGMTPLVAEDIAQCIGWAATRPPHVNIDEIVVRPRDQVNSTTVFRQSEPENA